MKPCRSGLSLLSLPPGVHCRCTQRQPHQRRRKLFAHPPVPHTSHELISQPEDAMACDRESTSAEQVPSLLTLQPRCCLLLSTSRSRSRSKSVRAPWRVCMLSYSRRDDLERGDEEARYLSSSSIDLGEIPKVCPDSGPMKINHKRPASGACPALSSGARPFR